MIKGNWLTRQVFINGRELLPARSQKVWNHSPDGWNWSYSGSGPAQLSLGLLLEFTDETTAKRLYQQFKWDIISKLPRADFELPIEEVKKWIQEHQKEMK